jgi:ATP-binding cassette subfamily A (ABC1) protein 3
MNADLSAFKLYTYIYAVNTVAQESPTYLLNLMNEAILRHASKNSKAKLEMTVSPFALTKAELENENTADGFIGSFIFSIGMSFIPASIISYIVKEREINMKHQ